MPSVFIIIILLFLGVLAQLKVTQHAKKTTNNTSVILENVLREGENTTRKYNEVREELENEIKQHKQ